MGDVITLPSPAAITVANLFNSFSATVGGNPKHDRYVSILKYQ